jgi:hypothetical protein
MKVTAALLFPVVPSGVVVVTLALFPNVVGETTGGGKNHILIVAVAAAAIVPRDTVTVPLLSEHVPTVVVQATNGIDTGSTSVTVTLSAGSVPEFVIPMTTAVDCPEAKGLGTGVNVSTRSGSPTAARVPEPAD